MTPNYEELIVRPDDEHLNVGVVYVGKEWIGYRVLVVPLEKLDEPWVAEARGEA